MKKNLLTSLAAAAMAFTAQAALPFTAAADLSSPLRQDAGTPTLTMQAPSRAGEGYFDFQYCYDPYTSLGLNSLKSPKVGAALQLTNELVTKFAGMKVTALLVANGSSQKTKPGTMALDIFCAESLTATPIATGTGTMNLAEPAEYVTYEFDTPVTIEAGKPLWFGYTTTLKSTSDMPIAIDYAAHYGQPGGYLGIGTSKSMEWEDIAPYYGFACIKVRIEGQGPENEATILDVSLPPRVIQNVETQLEAIICNQAVNELNSVEVQMSVNGQAYGDPVSANLSKPLEAGFTSRCQMNLPLTLTEAGENTVSLQLMKVNGVDCSQKGIEGSVTILCIPEDGNYPRTMVVEEGTGTWCGWCPRGIVGIEEMTKAHPDGSFIAIAAHSDDPMQISDYSSLFNKLPGFPGALVNRDSSIGGIDPNTATLQAAYEIITALPSIAKVEITNVTENADAKTATVDAAVTFGFVPSGTTYRLVYVLTEDNVGPYPQNNSFSGGSAGECGGWEKKGSPVTTYYNEVARAIKSYSGVANSIPSKPVAGTAYSHSASISLSKVTDLSRCSYIAMLLNTKTGEIENAVKVAGPAKTGIGEVEAETEEAGPTRYFDLQGREVLTPKAGQLLIRIQGSKADKVVF